MRPQSRACSGRSPLRLSNATLRPDAWRDPAKNVPPVQIQPALTCKSCVTHFVVKGHNMQVPLDITFQNSEPSETIRSEVERQAKRLEKFHDRITSCHVTVIAPTMQHRIGASLPGWPRGSAGPTGPDG